jgi:hypothetical protein
MQPEHLQQNLSAIEDAKETLKTANELSNKLLCDKEELVQVLMEVSQY